MEIYTNLLWGIGSHIYVGWEVPQSAICKLETQKSQYNSAQVQRPKHRVAKGLNPSPKAEEDETRWLN